MNEVINYFWLLCLAVWGGTVHYIVSIKKGIVKEFSISELVGEWTISGFAGLLVAFICTEQGFSWQITAVATGIAGHLGGPAIKLIELYIKKRVPMLLPNKQDTDD